MARKRFDGGGSPPAKPKSKPRRRTARAGSGKQYSADVIDEARQLRARRARKALISKVNPLGSSPARPKKR
jgi:hypothetical protein